MPFLAAEYRLAPESVGTTLAEDALVGVEWLIGDANELAVDPARIAVMGDSAGGGRCCGGSALGS